MRKKTIGIITLFLVFLLCIGATIYSKELSMDKFILESKMLPAEDLQHKIVRFHVIANSDEDVDQAVKMKVKDEVLKEITPKLEGSKSREETIEIIDKNKLHIKNSAKETLEYHGIKHDVDIELSTTYFPTKYYEDFSLPAGDYLALRVIIGTGEGQNWWCVLFPPLCLVDVRTEAAEPEPQEDNDKGNINDNINDNTDQSLEKSEKDNKNEENTDQDIKITDKASDDSIDLDTEDTNTDSKIDENDSEDKESQVKEDEEEDLEKVKIRWKTLELLGYYD